MKYTIPEISWHNRDPVLSIDIQPKNNTAANADFHRLASGGTDSHVLVNSKIIMRFLMIKFEEIISGRFGMFHKMMDRLI